LKQRGGGRTENLNQIAVKQPRYLYHGTLACHVPEILREGLKGGSFWGTRRMAEHWAPWKGDGSDEVVLIRRSLANFDPEHLFWDEFMAEEPVCFDYQVESDKREACAQAQGYWEESLAILESVWYMQAMPVKASDIISLKQLEPVDRDLRL
jgi:hypothetical protein